MNGRPEPDFELLQISKTTEETELPEGGKKIIRRFRFKMDTEDIVAIGCALVAVVIVLGVVFGAIRASTGLPLIAPFAGGAIIAEVVKAKRGRPKGSTSQ